MATPTKTPRRRRRTEVETFGCPYRYQQIFHHGIDDSWDESIRGRAWHDVALAYITRLVENHRQAMASGVVIPRGQVGQDHQEAQVAFQDGIAVSGCPDRLIPEVERLFFRWAENFELDLDAFMAAEELEQTGDREFRPDLVYCRPQEIEIVDFKTYYRGLTEDQAAKELQLRWYLIQAMKTWPGFPAYRFTFEFIRLNYRVSLVFTPEQIDAFEPSVSAKVAAIDKREQTGGSFEAIPGSHCAFCRLKCPVADNPKQLLKRIDSEAQAQEVFGQIIVLEQQLKQLKKALGGWCEIEGPQVLNGQVMAHWPQDTKRYPIQPLLEFLESKGYGLANITVSKSSLGSLAKQDDVKDFLASIEQVKSGWRFGHRKLGEVLPPGLEPDGDDDDQDS